MAKATSEARSRGQIVAKGSGRWQIRVTLGRDPRDGKWRRVAETIHGTRKDAEVRLTELLGKHDKGVPIPHSKMTLGEWLEQFATTWSGHLAPATQRKAREMFRMYLPGWLLGTKLSALRSRALQDHYNSLQESGKGPATISYLHRLLHTRLEKARKEGHLAINPAAGASPPAATHREYVTLSPEHAKAFLELAEGDRYGALWTLALTSALRPGELLGLKWEDLDGTTLRVRRALVRLGADGWRLEPTKTRKPRSVPLSRLALRLLQSHRAQQNRDRLALGEEYAPHGLVFASTFGEPLQWSTVTSRHFRPLLVRLACRLLGEAEGPTYRQGMKRAERQEAKAAFASRAAHVLQLTGLAGLRPYDLRHSAATLLMASGEHPKIVSELLGHSRVTLTLDTYSHVSANLVERASDRLESLILDSGKAAHGSP